MGVSTIRFHQFRNLADDEVVTEAGEVFLVGENGQGKSNFLEAVYLLAFGGSFRTRHEGDLIRSGEAEAGVVGIYSQGGERRRIAIALRRDGRKEIHQDGKAVADRKALAENIPAILFCHGDLAFVSGAPEQRRWFFNQTQSLFDPAHIDALRRYRRVLRSRNLALREGRRGLIEAYDAQLAAAGLEIQRRRQVTAAEFNEAFTPVFARVSGVEEELRIAYRPSWPAADLDGALAALGASRERDSALGVTTTGPHRDDFRFLLAGRNFARWASTGQIRLLALALRVAQAAHVRRMSRRKPVLLLDDVLLELDATRRDRFLAALPEYEQAFFTFLPDERYRQYRRPSTLVYTVRQGVLLPWSE